MNNKKIDYEELLEIWAKLVYEESDKAKEIYNYSEENSYKEIYHKGLSQGLNMAVALLSLAEKRYKHKLKELKES